MKHLSLFLIFCLLSFSSSAQLQDEKEVAKAVEKLREAMIDGNKAALENACAENLSYGHSSGRVENKTEFIENLVSGKSDFVTMDLSEQTISVTSHVAIVRHVLDASINDGGVSGIIKLKVLLVFEKEKEGWKLVARQAVKFA